MSKSSLPPPFAGTCAALATLAGLLASAPAQAVNLSQTGQGQVLIFPYYSVHEGNDTNLSIVNRTDQAKAVLVRFREARQADAVLTFSLFLAAHDQWVGAVTATEDVAKLISADPSCTLPTVPDQGLEFDRRLEAISGDGEREESRTRSGYIEVIEMGVVSDPTVLATLSGSGAQGSARRCDVSLLNRDMGPQQGVRALLPPSGGLTGGATLINVMAGTEYNIEPVVLEDFSSINLWPKDFSFSTDLPNLSSVNPRTSLVLANGKAVRSTWDQGEDAISALLMHISLVNEIVLEPSTQSRTDWVVTLPTRHFYVSSAPDSARAPFTLDSGAGRLCQAAREITRSRDAAIATAPLAHRLCWGTTNVLPFDYDRYQHLTDRSFVFTNGWGELMFDNNSELVSREGHLYYGLPVTGFMMHNFVNGNVNGLLSNYGGNFQHKYTTLIEAP
ncbi:MAG: hypothetical protein ABWY06_23100 [Pseudomonas sp.]|uniref:hypothetical protein n=1 Tax=Pseudomonas sp. TaxID=306 RepID=UPI0033935C96